MRSTVPGYWRDAAAGRIGLRSKGPPQLGHFPLTRVAAHSAQNVHSNEQIRASDDSGGRSRLQHSQFGFISSIDPSLTLFGKLPAPWRPLPHFFLSQMALLVFAIAPSMAVRRIGAHGHHSRGVAVGSAAWRQRHGVLGPRLQYENKRGHRENPRCRSSTR